MASGYIEYQYWSQVFGGYASRLSMFNDRGHEFYIIIPRGEGKAHRVARTEALSLVQEAIEYGLDPGEVVRADDEC